MKCIPTSNKSQPFKPLGRPRLTQELRNTAIRMAKENILWGYRRIAGELKKLDLYAGATTIKRILTEAGIHPTPEKKGPVTEQCCDPCQPCSTL